MRYVVASEKMLLGRQGENQVQTVQFDVDGWSDLYGEGTFTLLHQRSNDTEAYPCSVTLEDGKINWLIEAADVSYTGIGKAQLIYSVGGKIAKTMIFATQVLPSLNEGELPDPTPSWITEVLQAAETAENAAAEAQHYAESINYATVEETINVLYGGT